MKNFIMGIIKSIALGTLCMLVMTVFPTDNRYLQAVVIVVMYYVVYYLAPLLKGVLTK